MSTSQQALTTLYRLGADGDALALMQEHAYLNGKAFAREAIIPDWIDWNDPAEDYMPDIWEANEPIAPLSGEWSGEPTHRSLATRLGLPSYDDDPDGWQEAEDAIDTYYMHNFDYGFEAGINDRLAG